MIDIQHLTKSYGRRGVLSDLNLTLEPGVCGLLGANGAGKTTLMRSLLGLLKYEQGTIRIHDQIIRSGTPLPSVGYLPQRFDLYRDLTVRDMLAYLATIKRIPGSQHYAVIKAGLDQVHLSDRADVRCRTLSGGMIRRVGIAQALMGDPEIIMMDEPTAGLDPEERIRFQLIMRSLNPKQIALLSTHIVEDLEGLCDTVAILMNGQIVVHAAPQEIAAQADGLVWEITDQNGRFPSARHIIVKKWKHEDRVRWRILTAGQPDDVFAPERMEPTLEDGYMAILKGLIQPKNRRPAS